jgi:hypothetical protein
MRDYSIQPLKYGEQLPKQELIYYYIERNLNKQQCADIFNCCIPKIDKALKLYNIQKDNESLQQSKRQTNLQRYGVDNPAKSKDIQQKMKQTCKQRYGVENYNQTEECKNKKKQTSLKRFGTENPRQLEQVKQRYKNTCKQRYGVDNPFKLKDYIKQCVMDKYGQDNYFKTQEFKEKSKQTCLERYGVEYSSQNKDIQQKVKQTNIERYGTYCSAKNEQVKQKIKDTCMQKYGYDNPSKVPQIIDKIECTKSRNHSHNKSQDEDIIYNLLCSKFDIVQRNIRNELYPFKIDFYIPQLDLYIEYQGIWVHGKQPFDPRDEQHIQILNKWKQKAINSQFYKNAINIWTVTDPLKRQTAKENNLNWIEFFTLEEFIEWFKNN